MMLNGPPTLHQSFARQPLKFGGPVKRESRLPRDVDPDDALTIRGPLVGVHYRIELPRHLSVNDLCRVLEMNEQWVAPPLSTLSVHGHEHDMVVDVVQSALWPSTTNNFGERVRHRPGQDPSTMALKSGWLT